MERTTSDAHTHVEPELTSTTPASATAPLNIRWGRTLIAAVGLLAILTAGISGLLNLFSIGSAALSWTGLLVFLAVLGGLRALAVRDQNARRSAWAAAERATAEAGYEAEPAAAVVPRETVLFDGAEGSEAAENAPVQRPLTAEELRNAALRVAAKGTADAKLAHTQTLAEGDLFTETWEPVEVPTPGYVTAARAAAAASKPLAIPAVPKSAGTSIKADQAGIGVVAVDGPAPVAAPAVASDGKPEEASVTAAKPVAAAHGLNNLDVVLQRRRA